jgi:hypothetical protein
VAETLPGLGVARVEQEDAAEDIGGFAPAVLSEELTAAGQQLRDALGSPGQMRAGLTLVGADYRQNPAAVQEESHANGADS